MHFVPSMLQAVPGAVCEWERAHSLRQVVCSGEELSRELCKGSCYEAAAGRSCHNLYGPTEAAVDVTYWECARAGSTSVRSPIGRPIANTQIYVLDRASAAGADRRGGRDLYRRSGVARGYLNRPELTAERFVRGSVQRGSAGADVQDGRSGPLAGGRDDRVPGAQRSSGEDPRLPDRAGRDRGAAGAARAGERSGGAGARGCAGREAPGGVCDGDAMQQRCRARRSCARI